MHDRNPRTYFKASRQSWKSNLDFFFVGLVSISRQQMTKGVILLRPCGTLTTCGIDPTKSFEQMRDAIPVTVSRDASPRSAWANIWVQFTVAPD
jgi:hypothetical protein